MAIDFYSEKAQAVSGPVVMLPQKGSVSGGSHRPLNSYAIGVDDSGRRATVLFDAPYSWVTEAVFELHDGAPILEHILSHKDVVGSADAMDRQHGRLGIPFRLHPDDHDALDDETASDRIVPIEPSDLLEKLRFHVIHMPGHTPGSVMLYLEDAGLLLAGDSAVGPGPRQGADAPRLERTVMSDDLEATFCDAFERLVDRLPRLDGILPLHGDWCLKSEIGSEAFDLAVRNVWEGMPMDPRQ